MCVLLSGDGYQQPCFIPDKLIFDQKIFCTFGQCVIFKNPYNPRVFYISRKSALAARRGMCSTQASHSNFNLSTTSLNYQNPTQNTQKSFENYFDVPSKSPLFSTISSPLKIPQSHRITLKSHSKITKSQIKSTHSRTKSNNPTITT